jgi:hypothetical protein
VFVAVVQPSFFADEDLAPPPTFRKADPNLARNKLIFMLNLMRDATKWPWREEQLRVIRETLWPQALTALPPEEAARFRAEIEAESARLDGIGIA